MAEFVPITTQEDLDKVISKRLQRERETVMSQFADYDELKQKVTDYEGQIGTLTQERDSLQAAVKGHETNSVKMRIAHETGIPFEMATRLSGDNEKDIRADAEAIAKFMTAPRSEPVRSTEPTGVVKTSDAAYKAMLQKMKGE